MIESYLPSLRETIESSPLTLINTSPGTGMSYLLPRFLIEQNIPRILLSTTTSKRSALISRYINSSPGKEITIMSHRKMKNLLLDSYQKHQCLPISSINILILDQFQLNDLNLQVILEIWKHCAPQGHVPHLVLIGWFRDRVRDEFFTTYPEAYEMIISDENYPLEINYHEINYYPYDQTIYQDIKEMLSKEAPETTLIFIEEGKVNLDLEGNVIDLDNPDMEEIFNPHYPIILLASSQSVIPFLPYQLIIDSLMAPGKSLSMAGGRREEVTYISQYQSQERAHCAGITTFGSVKRMMTSKLYHQLPLNPPLTIQRDNLIPTLIDFSQYHINPTSLLPGYQSILHPLLIGLQYESNLIKGSSQEVMKPPILGHLQGSSQEVMKTSSSTILGHPQGRTFLNKSPLGWKNSLVLWDYLNANNPQPRSDPHEIIVPLDNYSAIVILSLIDNYDLNFLLFSNRDSRDNLEVYQVTRFEQGGNFKSLDPCAQSDVHYLTSLWTTMLSNLSQVDVQNVVLWARNHSINHHKLQQTYQIINEVVLMVRRLGYDVTETIFDVDLSIDLLRPFIKKIYHDNLYVLNYESLPRITYQDPHGDIYNLNPHLPTKLKMNHPPTLMALMTYTFESSFGVPINYILVGLNVE